MASKFHIEKRRLPECWELKLSGLFDGTSAWELRHAMARLGKRTPVIIDFSDVTELWEFGAATLAAGFLARRWPPVQFVGLRPEYRATLRVHGLEPEPADAQRAARLHPVFGQIEPVGPAPVDGTLTSSSSGG